MNRDARRRSGCLVFRALKSAFAAAAFALACCICGCTYYSAPAPGYYVVKSSSFDRSWSAVLGAYADQGLNITSENRETGVVRGQRNGIELTTTVTRQEGGSIRVQFDTAGATDTDPQLITRVSNAYDRRMGR